MDHSPPRIAVLTRTDSNFGYNFLKELQTRGCEPVLICAERTPFKKRLKILRSLAKRIGWQDALTYNLAFWKPLLLRKLSLGRFCPLPPIETFSKQYLVSSSINSPEVVSKLQATPFDVLVCAQSGIIRSPILKLAKRRGIPVLNAHPAKTPEYRGVDVVRWTLLKGGPVGVTLHLIDEGIDTGAIIQFDPVGIEPKDTPSSIKRRLVEHSIRLLVDAALGHIDISKAKPIDGNCLQPQLYLMPKRTSRSLMHQWSDILKNYLLQQAAQSE